MEIRNIPLIGKFLLVLGVFGLFTIGVTVFGTARLMPIDTGCGSTIDHGAVGGIAVASCNGRLGPMRAGARKSVPEAEGWEEF